MEKLMDNINKELECIAEQGISNGNIENLSKLVDIKKDIVTIQAMEDEGKMRYYDENPYSYYGERYRGRYDGGRYGMDRYRGREDHLSDRVYRILDGMDAYRYGRERYRDSGNGAGMEDGLEDLMYAVCTFVESLTDAADTPQEKEIIRKHINKLKSA